MGLAASNSYDGGRSWSKDFESLAMVVPVRDSILQDCVQVESADQSF